MNTRSISLKTVPIPTHPSLNCLEGFAIFFHTRWLWQFPQWWQRWLNILDLSTTWNDLFYICVDDVSIWWKMFWIFAYLSLLCWFQFNSRIIKHITLNNWEMIAETRSYSFRWRSRCRRSRLCLRSLSLHLKLFWFRSSSTLSVNPLPRQTATSFTFNQRNVLPFQALLQLSQAEAVLVPGLDTPNRIRTQLAPTCTAI